MSAGVGYQSTSNTFPRPEPSPSTVPESPASVEAAKAARPSIRPAARASQVDRLTRATRL